MLTAKARFVMTCPYTLVDRDFRPETFLWLAVFAWLSKTVQSFEELRSYDLALDNAIFCDGSNTKPALAQKAGNSRRVPYEKFE